jgi:hypothetical protein
VIVRSVNELDETEARFVLMKSAGSVLSVSPNPAIKDVDIEAKIVILDNQTSDNSFEVTLDDFNGVRQQTFRVEGKTFPIDLSHLELGSYVITVKGESSLFQEDIQLTMKGSSYLILNPNPVVDNLSIEVMNPVRADMEYKVVISDKLGNVYRDISTKETSLEVDVSDLNPDLYYLQIFDGYQKLGKIFRKLD